jgi:hypothetical protein
MKMMAHIHRIICRILYITDYFVYMSHLHHVAPITEKGTHIYFLSDHLRGVSTYRHYLQYKGI